MKASIAIFLYTLKNRLNDVVIERTNVPLVNGFNLGLLWLNEQPALHKPSEGADLILVEVSWREAKVA